MKTSQFDAKTFGVGELITQRKLFRVPQHQRSYAWEPEAVDSFLDDIERAFKAHANEYFIGLVVIQGPIDSEWVLLDGQQRLTTSALMFSAIKRWLDENGFPQDAEQISHEYLGVRRLGGKYSSRMLLNSENQSVFEGIAIGQTDLATLRSQIREMPKRSSNRLLSEAFLKCREWVNTIADSAGGDKKDKSRALFDLALFIDSRLKVVCVEVSSDVDAYILFEALNDRGTELSALDLLKNYVYSKTADNKEFDLEKNWASLTEMLAEVNPDDFLKVFWTSRNGLVQKAQIFRKIREKYDTDGKVINLVTQLKSDANILEALQDQDHPFWTKLPPSLKHQVRILGELSARQTRSVILAGVNNLDANALEKLLWYLTVSIVRFQIIGKGRTGIVEKVFGRLCEGLSDSSIRSMGDMRACLGDLDTPDADFIESFSRHQETKYSRIAYFLACLQLQEEGLVSERHDIARGLAVSNLLERSTLHSLVPRSLISKLSFDDDRYLYLLGNYYLSSNEENVAIANRFKDISEDQVEELQNYLSNRTVELAYHAASIWQFDRI